MARKKRLTKRESARLAKIAQEELERLAAQAKEDELARLAAIDEPTFRNKVAALWHGLMTGNW